jgi:NADH-quinone oxidoreductase subunit G
MVKVEINGQVVEAREGDMLIDVADKAQISIPRFCYHKKLSIAANCRMCLVEVEGAWKPLPACATPVTDGMKVHTKSAKAIAAQKSVMEFLLINHPLDCPICDQGGECELQDVAMDYGDDVSRYTEAKRIVGDRDAGSLIQTDMTRCIHCTRCVRFGQEVAGMMELGATGRSEWMEIGTYIEKSITSEMSGNMIDLCPVGALTSKPFRYTARAWELKSHHGIAAHDSIGSNIILHAKDDQVMRVVPRENEAINEVWISDRDRFSYEGINANDRLTQPQIKRNGQWETVDWETALQFCVDNLQNQLNGSVEAGVLASASSTLEELHLLQKLARGLGIENLDHRLRQSDFSMDKQGFHTPKLETSIESVESLNSVLLVGSYLRKELPILNHRIRKAVLAGGQAHSLNPLVFDVNYPLANEIVADQNNMVQELAAIAKAALEMVDQNDQAWSKEITVDERHRAIALSLKEAEQAAVMLGQIAHTHASFATLQSLAALIAKATGASLNILPLAANEVGAHLVKFLPVNGKNVVEMYDAALPVYINYGIEPELDSIHADKALNAMQQAKFVINFTAFDSQAQRDYANVLLPIATFAETAGTYINANGTKQSFKMSVEPKGEAKAGWKVLRVLGNLFDLQGFEQTHSNQVLAEVMDNVPHSLDFASIPVELDRVNETYSLISPYAIDAIVRRAPSLQATPDADAQPTVRG